MNLDEYKAEIKRLTELPNTYNEQMALGRKFALDNNKVNVGDIVSSSYAHLKVEKIIVNLSSNVPFCIYSGIRYTKKGTPYKDGSRIGIPSYGVTRILPGYIDEY